VRIFDCFPFNDELDMLECRFTELEDVVDAFVVVEASTTHQGDEKSFHLHENYRRFERWGGKIHSRMMHFGPGLDAWGRDRAQREELFSMLRFSGARPDDIVLLSDVDEIPNSWLVASLRRVPPTSGMVSFEQRFCPFAVDWEHPEKWYGTVATLWENVSSMNALRDSRGQKDRVLQDGGFHFSWMGGAPAAYRKLHSFAHPEIVPSLDETVRSNLCYLEGRHVDGVKLLPVDVDESYPRYVLEHRCPEIWFRRR
jgi:hypothetical protein